jgi:mono/diheme cytochrome c family protein
MRSLKIAMRRERIAIAFLGLCVLGALGFLAFAWRSSIAPIDPPASTNFPAELIAKGEALAGAGYCANCHTAKGGATYAGGYGMPTPFGVIYSTNVTPDPETGIGRWSEAAFARALHEGVARDGSHLFPAFPFDHFTKVTDEDVKALYAYFMTRPPVRATAQSNTLPFPLNIRLLQAGWKLLFVANGRYQPDSTKSAEWNRGAYLAEGLSHCGACHTPRNLLGAERSSRAYAGGEVDGWIAPPLTDANPAPAPWSQADLFSYLRSGSSAVHGTAAGSMSPVVHGLAKLPDSDIEAIAIYFADINRSATRAVGSQASVISKAVSTSGLGIGQEPDPDARLYVAACGSCHYNSGAPLEVRPELALNTALTLPEPTNFIRVVLDGIGIRDGMPGVMMPGFARALSDSDIARLAAYLRRTRTELPAWTNIESKVAAIRKEQPASQ